MCQSKIWSKLPANRTKTQSQCMNRKKYIRKALNYRRLSNFCHRPKAFSAEKEMSSSQNVVLLRSAQLRGHCLGHTATPD